MGRDDTRLLATPVCSDDTDQQTARMQKVFPGQTSADVLHPQGPWVRAQCCGVALCGLDHRFWKRHTVLADALVDGVAEERRPLLRTLPLAADTKRKINFFSNPPVLWWVSRPEPSHPCHGGSGTPYSGGGRVPDYSLRILSNGEEGRHPLSLWPQTCS